MKKKHITGALAAVIVGVLAACGGAQSSAPAGGAAKQAPAEAAPAEGAASEGAAEQVPAESAAEKAPAEGAAEVGNVAEAAAGKKNKASAKPPALPGKAGDKAAAESGADNALAESGADKAPAKAAVTARPEHIFPGIKFGYQDVEEGDSYIGGYSFLQLEAGSSISQGLETSLKALAGESREWSAAHFDEVRKYADEMRQERGDDYWGYPYVTEDAQVLRSDEAVLSIYEDREMTDGETVDEHWRRGLTFDPGTGKKLLLSDVLSRPMEAPMILADVIRESYPDQVFDSGMSNTILGMMAKEASGKTGGEGEAFEELSFTIGYREIRIYIQDGLLTSRMGGIEVSLPFDEYPDFVKEEYRNVPEDYIYPVDVNRSYSLDGTKRFLRLEYEELEEMEGLVTIHAGDSTYMTEYMYEPSAWLLRRGGKDFLLVRMPTGDVSFYMHVFDLNGGEINIPKTVEMALDYGNVSTDPDRVNCYYWVSYNDGEPKSEIRALGADGLPEGAEPAEHEVPDFEDATVTLQYRNLSTGYLNQGMHMMDEGVENVRGGDCRIVAYGTGDETKFTREARFAVYDWSTIFEYDPVKDAWIQK